MSCKNIYVGVLLCTVHGDGVQVPELREYYILWDASLQLFSCVLAESHILLRS